MVHRVAKSQTRLSDLTFNFHFSLSCIGEGNGNRLQSSCLENPRYGGAWLAAVYGVAQSQTRLKWLSSSSSSSSRVETMTRGECREVCLKKWDFKEFRWKIWEGTHKLWTVVQAFQVPSVLSYSLWVDCLLEWIAISFSRGSSHPGIKSGSPALQAESWLSSEPPGTTVLKCKMMMG